MKAKELITLLEGLNPESEVFFLPANGMYVQDFSPSFKQDVNIRALFGDDRKGVVIGSGGQVGSI